MARNPVVDIIDVISRGAPVFFGREESTSSSSSIDPKILAQQQDLYGRLLQRGTSTAQADKVIEDILYRAQLAFAPVLGEEKQAGVYNTTVRRQMANEAVARATQAAAEAVMRDQQIALQQAAQLNAATQQNTRSTQQQTKVPGLGQQILGGVGTAILANEAYKLGKKGVGKGKDILSKLFGGSKESTQGFDEVGFQDIEDYFLASGESGASVDLGAFNAPGAAGNFSSASFAGGGGAVGFDAGSGQFIADDTAALEAIINSTEVPSISEGTQVADSGATTTDVSAPLLASEVSIADTRPIEEIITSQGLTPGAAMPPATLPIPGSPGENFPMPPAQFADSGQIMSDASVDVPAEPFGGFDTEAVVAEDFSAASLEGGDLPVGAEVSQFVGPAINLAAGNERGAFGSFAGGALAGPVGAVVGSIVADPLMTVYHEGLEDIGGRNFANFLDPVGTLTASDDVGQNIENFVEAPFEMVANPVREIVEEIPVVGDVAEDSVVCSEAVKQGLLDWRLRAREVHVNINIRKLSIATIRGYHYMAYPLVKKMRKDKQFAERMAAIATAYCKHVTEEEKSFTGWAVRWIGEPIAWLVGYFIVPEEFNVHQEL